MRRFQIPLLFYLTFVVLLCPSFVGHARVRHFLLDAGTCYVAGFFLSFLMQHTPMMTSRWKPCSPISHSCEICGRFLSVASRSDRQDQFLAPMTSKTTPPANANPPSIGGRGIRS